MEKYPTMMISKINGIDHNFLNVIRFEQNDKKTWAIRNRFGKTTPFFENEFNPFIYSEQSFLCMGKQDNKNELYMIETSYSPDGELFWKVDIEGDLDSIQLFDDKNYLLKTSKGVYLFDRFSLLKKSDFFDQITVQNNRYLFEKNIDCSGKKYSYLGEVDKNGCIKPFLYDSENDTFISTPYKRDDSSYDKIDEFSLREDICFSELRKKKHMNSNIEKLNKLNR